MIKEGNNLLKSTSLLVSSQFLKILFGVIGTKLTAIFLGPTGVGIVGLITNTINLITTATGFGIDFSGVREISLAHAQKNDTILSRKLVIMKRLMLFSSLIATIIMVCFSSKLSIWILGNELYTDWFIILAIVFIFNALRTYYSVKLQGTQNLKLLASSWLYSSFMSTVLSGLLYYFLREQGIIPVIIVTAIVNMLVGFYFSRKIPVKRVTVSWPELKKESGDLIKLGAVFSINSLVGLSSLYIIRLFITKTTSPETLGFYEAGILFSSYYVSFIFSAMTSDFYPRLTAINHNISEVNIMVNRQIELTLLIIVPAILLLYSAAPLLIKILFSVEFSPVVNILKGVAFALIIKSISWPLAYIVLAKGDRKQFFYQELFSDVFNIIATLLLFKYFGLIGIGISHILSFTFYGFYINFMVKKKYGFQLEANTKKIIISSLILGGICACISFILDYPIAYYINPIFLVVSIFYSLKILKERFNFKLTVSNLPKF